VSRWKREVVLSAQVTQLRMKKAGREKERAQKKKKTKTPPTGCNQANELQG